MTSVVVGDLNRNGQRLVAKTSIPGNDHMQHLWIAECGREECGHRYGVNSSDFFQRKCPRCQGGVEGLSIEGVKYADRA
jgi:hypothetical protein